MATQFSRLYRELCQSSPHDPVSDIYFTKERKGVLSSLGYSVNLQKDVPVQLCKHHGKGARRRAPAAKLKAIGIEDSIKSKKEREIRQMSMKTAKVQELTNKIQGLLSEDKFVSQNLWSQYDKIYGQSQNEPVTTRKPKKNSEAAPSVTKLKKGQETKAVQKRTKSDIRIDYSKNKWSKSEREKLNTIYWELKRPTSNSMALWNNYFQEFASIFHVYFAARSIESIIQKVKYMYSTRQFAEPGESSYWHSLTADSHLSSAKGTGKSIQSNGRPT